MVNKIEPRIWKHVILQGDDDEKLRDLRTAAERLSPQRGQSVPTQTLDEVDAYAVAAKAADDFAAEANARGVEVTLRTVGRKKWRELVDACPAREGDEKDAIAGVDLDAFPEVLVPACITGPTFSEGELVDFLDSLTPAQFDFLAAAAWSLHRNLGADPKERLLSAPEAS